MHEEWPTCLCGWVVDMVPVYYDGWFDRWATTPCLACMINPQFTCGDCGTTDAGRFVGGTWCLHCTVPLCKACREESVTFGHDECCRTCSLEFCDECQRVGKGEADVRCVRDRQGGSACCHPMDSVGTGLPAEPLQA